MADATPDSSDQLILSALDLFGRHGFEGTSTRLIAKAAGKPMSLITYHFGGKNELYVAVARYIAARMADLMAPTLAAMRTADDGGPANARSQIHTIFSAMLTIMLGSQSASWARFIVREQMEPTPAFDELYNGPMGPLLRHLTGLVQRVASYPIEEGEARLRAVAMFGQVLVFRVARAAVLRSTGWSDIGSTQVEQVRAVVLAQIDAILDSMERKDKP
ncbi:CerR family C-terminal domain-containing protein [Sphingomonas sp. H39-1-10]|uniref:CerR family C-terminal domain-containing protein n=1 Tax=Sphingomonas pollutisoli TaxID=3030829 RepID=UPI0023B9FB8C|nr:CerR family C-terminal domain-containing protein [Sphingomonas pollutisoli]MDF0491441.1 CerR family C-terminal domain-containing protein [Sphingomonas pollutisoli]